MKAKVRKYQISPSPINVTGAKYQDPIRRDWTEKKTNCRSGELKATGERFEVQVIDKRTDGKIYFWTQGQLATDDRAPHKCLTWTTECHTHFASLK